MGGLRQFPAFVVLLLIASGLMLIPAGYAATMQNWLSARTFLYHGLFFAILGGILGFASMNYRPHSIARYHLLTLLLAYLLLPVALAAPLTVLAPALGAGGAYFEMLSSLTTTGATLIDQPGLVAESVHLWRALVGWAGGLMILVAAFAVLAPLNLGGFEIEHDTREPLAVRQGGSDDTARRVLRTVRVIAPVYAGFTAILATLLILAGDRPFVAVSHAMATLSTSGISPVGDLAAGRAGWFGEAAVALFLLPAVSHRSLTFDLRRERLPRLSDPQIQLVLISILAVTILLFLRNFIGAAEIDRQHNFVAALRALWGSLFTILSYLTTTGFESQDWLTMQIWSDLPAPGVILLGVAVMGGGIATTAGGVKLLRLYALYLHGVRELDLLIYPHGIGRRGQGVRLISEGGARIAFVFLMLFLITIALLMMALSLTGLNFEQSLTLAIAGLTTTGPAIGTLGDGLGYGSLNAPARSLFCLAMIVGRMEALVIIALFNPAYWRQ